jgi:nitroreductase
MEFFAVIHTRQSIRAFQDKPIDPAVIQQILDVINRAPSAGNLQSYEVYLVTDRAVIQSLARATNGQDFITQAPLALVFCAHPARAALRYRERGTSLYCIQDATIASAYAQLAVTALGLASVWVGAFNEEVVRRAINVGHDLRPVAFLPIGYAAEAPERRSRRELTDLVQRLE